MSLQEYSCLPEEIKSLERLNEGNGIKASMLKNNAKFHRTCNLRYNQNEVNRAVQPCIKKVRIANSRDESLEQMPMEVSSPRSSPSENRFTRSKSVVLIQKK